MTQAQTQGFGAFGLRLQFEAGGFIYAGRHYDYSAVRGVEFKQKTLQRTTDKGRQLVYDSRLRVILADGRKVNITVNGLSGRHQRTEDKKIYDSIASAAEWLSAYTFDVRMDAYDAAFKKVRFLTWGLHEIAGNGDLFRRYTFCLNLKGTDVRCMLFSHHMACFPRPKTWWKRWLGMIIRSHETVDLRRDRDCFLYFMRRYVGISWPSEKLRLYRGKAADGSTDKPKEPESPGANGAGTDGPRAEQRHQAPPVQKVMPTHPQYLAVLGLTPDVKWDVVRTTYRQLARQHHPDLMRGRGASEVNIKLAEEKLKTFNEAYGWLEDFYKLKPKHGA